LQYLQRSFDVKLLKTAPQVFGLIAPYNQTCEQHPKTAPLPRRAPGHV
jgi:hypothetical protein